MGILNDDLSILMKQWYPAVPGFLQSGCEYGDHFSRNNFEDTATMDMYTVDGTGTNTFPATVIYPKHGGRLTTGAVIGNDASWLTFYCFTIGKEAITSLELKAKVSLVQTATTEIFLGFIDRTAVLTALPTTITHAGIVYDASVSANWRTSSADGTAQNINSTSTAADTSDHTFTITWTSSSVAFKVDSTSFTSHTANLPTSELGHNITFYIQTEAAAAKSLDYDMWKVKYT